MKFHLGDILSITTGVLLAKRGMDAVYEIEEFLTGEELTTLALGIVQPKCKASLLKQLPKLQPLDREVTALCDSFVGISVKEKENRIDAWMADQIKIYGEYFEIEPIKGY